MSARTDRDARPDPRLVDAAARLWPHSESLRREWLRAVALVRGTRGGWLLERRQERRGA